MQGSGKTTLLKAILNKSKPSTAAYDDAVSDIDMNEVIADGLCYCDSVGINMQVFFFFILFLFAFPCKVACALNIWLFSKFY